MLLLDRNRDQNGVLLVMSVLKGTCTCNERQLARAYEGEPGFLVRTFCYGVLLLNSIGALLSFFVSQSEFSAHFLAH